MHFVGIARRRHFMTLTQNPGEAEKDFRRRQAEAALHAEFGPARTDFDSEDTNFVTFNLSALNKLLRDELVIQNNRTALYQEGKDFLEEAVRRVAAGENTIEDFSQSEPQPSPVVELSKMSPDAQEGMSAAIVYLMKGEFVEGLSPAAEAARQEFIEIMRDRQGPHRPYSLPAKRRSGGNKPE